MKGRFFVTLDADAGDRAYLDAFSTRHVRALRLVAGDAVCAIVAPGRERSAVITRIERERVVLALGPDLPPAGRDLPSPLTLAIALGDSTRMDLVVEKATELGASAIQPFVAERSQARAIAASRLERWRRIARSACEQCGRTIEPEIRDAVPFVALKAQAAAAGVVWLMDPRGERPVPAPRSDDASDRSSLIRSLLLVVGPEGGLADDEVAALAGLGARRIGLGRRILRFETAAIAALTAALVCLPGDESPV